MGRRHRQPGCLMLRDHFGAWKPLERSGSVCVSGEPGKHLCVLRGTGRPHLSTENPPGLGEEPSWCLCPLNRPPEREPSVAGSGCNQIERTRENRVQ